MRITTMAELEEFGTPPSKALLAFIAHYRQTISDSCALVRVQIITSLKQGKDNWTITYSIHDAKISEQINPTLALELLDRDLVGTSLEAAWFIINPARIEEMIMIDVNAA